MSLRILNRFPGANGAILSIDDQAHEVVFAPEPRPGAEALWFHLRAADPQPPNPPPSALRFTLAFADTLPPGVDAASLRPVCRERGKNAQRVRAPLAAPPPEPGVPPAVTWEVPYPARDGTVDFVLDFPYAADDLAATLRRSNGFWSEETVGLLPGGAVLRRLSSGQPPAPSPHALYLVARRNPSATPGSWALDGMLEAFSRAHSAKWRVWAIPFADPFGVDRGASGSAPATDARLRALVAADETRWAAGARPELVLEVAASDPGGAVLECPAGDGPAAKAAETWANIFTGALSADFAADAFVRKADPATLLPAPDGVPSLRLRVPFGRIHGAQAAPRNYRELGQATARATLARW